MRRPTAVLCACFSGLIFFTPFFLGAVHAWAFMTLAACLFLLLSCFPQALFEAEKIQKIPKLMIPLTLVLISFQIWGWAVDRHAALSQFILWLALSCAFLLIQLLDESEIRKLLGVFVLAALFQAAYSFWQARQIPEMVLWRIKESHQGYWTGTYLNRNHLAGFFEMALGVSGGFLFFEAARPSRKVQTGVWAVIFFVLMTGLLRTGSRFGCGAFIILAIATCLGLVLKQPKIRPWIGLLAIGGLILLASQSGVLLKRFTLEEGTLESSSGRWWVWQDAWRLFQHYGFFGTVLGGFGRAFPQYQSAHLLMGWDHAHNDYLELMIELGLPVLLVWMTGWAVLGLGMVRRLFHLGADQGWLAGGTLLGVFSLVLHGFSDFNFSVPANRFLFVFLTACAYRLLHLPQFREEREAGS